MPEACKFIEVEIEDNPTIENGEVVGGSVEINEYDPCGRIADHRVVLEIEGVGRRQEFLCCQHRTQTVEEIFHNDHCGVTLVEDRIIGAKYICQVVPMGMAVYAYRIIITSQSGSHTLPLMMLEATTAPAAKLEAQEKTEAFRIRNEGPDGRHNHA